MGTVADDIKDVYSEIGTAFTILRDAGNISGEKLDFDLNAQATKPFIREFFLEAATAYDTQTIAGDVIRFDLTSGEYMIMNKTADVFENTAIEYSLVLYKTNTSGKLLRPSGEATWDAQNYKKVQNWTTIKDPCYALLTEPVYGEGLEEEQVGLMDKVKKEFYCPTSYGIKPMDRIEPVSGEYYFVDSVKKRRYDNVDVAILLEDTR